MFEHGPLILKRNSTTRKNATCITCLHLKMISFDKYFWKRLEQTIKRQKFAGVLYRWPLFGWLITSIFIQQSASYTVDLIMELDTHISQAIFIKIRGGMVQMVEPSLSLHLLSQWSRVWYMDSYIYIWDSVDISLFVPACLIMQRSDSLKWICD